MIALTDEQLHLLASLIAEQLADRAAGELIDAAELARRLGWTRERVYDNADRLGAIELGDGARPRLAFRWPQALDGLTARSRSVRSQTSQSPAAAGAGTKRPRQRLGTSTDLLPIGGSRRRPGGA